MTRQLAERTAAQAEYAEYLATPEWRERRLRAIERADGRCQLCNSGKRLHVHHRTYERRGRERDSDLTVLCQACHDHFHGRTGGPKRHLTVAAPASASTRREPSPAELRAEFAPILPLIRSKLPLPGGTITAGRLRKVLPGRSKTEIRAALAKMARHGELRQLSANCWTLADSNIASPRSAKRPLERAREQGKRKRNRT